MTRIDYRIAHTARITLGRPAHRSTGGCPDWSAVEAIKAAAADAGMTGQLLRWVPPAGASLRAIARAWCSRYAEAYGPGPWGHDECGAAASLAAVR